MTPTTPNALKILLTRVNGTAEVITSNQVARLKYGIEGRAAPSPSQRRDAAHDLQMFLLNHGPEWAVEEVRCINWLAIEVRRVKN